MSKHRNDEPEQPPLPTPAGPIEEPGPIVGRPETFPKEPEPKPEKRGN